MYTKVLSGQCLELKPKQILNKTFKYLVLATLPSVMLACGGGSGNGGGSNNTGVNLALTAPSMYPAGSSLATNAMLTLNNTSN